MIVSYNSNVVRLSVGIDPLPDAAALTFAPRPKFGLGHATDTPPRRRAEALAMKPFLLADSKNRVDPFGDMERNDLARWQADALERHADIWRSGVPAPEAQRAA